MISFDNAEKILRKAMNQQPVERGTLSVVGFPCAVLVPWLTHLLKKEQVQVQWEKETVLPVKTEWESLSGDSSFCCLLPFFEEETRGVQAAFFVEDLETAGNGALLCARLGIVGTFFTELKHGNWYMASVSGRSIHSEIIRPEQLALPAFGYTRTQLKNKKLAAISFGSFLLRAAGKAESLLTGADKARHVLYDREQ